jgi:hypothetical protein
MHEINHIKFRLEPEKLWNYYTLALNILSRIFLVTVSYLLLEHVVYSDGSLSVSLLSLITSMYIMSDSIIISLVDHWPDKSQSTKSLVNR